MSTTKWLKRIFSLEFLGVVIGAAGLYLAYQQLANEKPGNLQWSNAYGTLSEDTKYIIVSQPYTGDSVLLMNETMPFLKSNKKQVEDLLVMANIPAKTNFSIRQAYTTVRQAQTGKHDNIEAALEIERLGANHAIPFPVQVIYPVSGETIKLPVTVACMYKDKNSVLGTAIHLVVYPADGQLTEKMFMKAIKPLLLIADKNGQLDKTAVLYENKIIENLDIDKIKTDKTWKLENWQ